MKHEKEIHEGKPLHLLAFVQRRAMRIRALPAHRGKAPLHPNDAVVKELLHAGKEVS